MLTGYRRLIKSIYNFSSFRFTEGFLLDKVVCSWRDKKDYSGKKKSDHFYISWM